MSATEKHSPIRLTRRDFLKSAAALVVVAATGCQPDRPPLPVPETRTVPFKETALALKWSDLKDPEKIQNFTLASAQEYIRLTKSPRVKLDQLTNNSNLTFYSNRQQYLQAVRTYNPEYNSATGWGYTDYQTGRVLVDLSSLESQARSQTERAGLALLDALWHEWGHRDVEERKTGELIGNSQKVFFYSPVSKTNEAFERYRGDEVFTKTWYGLKRFEEVINETITVRRMTEQVGLSDVISAGDYYQNGVDFFVKLTQATGISLDDLYQLHATSDLEGLLKKLGQKLPKNGDPLAKGYNLAVGIHQSNRQTIESTGALSLISNK